MGPICATVIAWLKDLLSGQAQTPVNEPTAFERIERFVGESIFFNQEDYLALNSDLKEAKVDPLQHFLAYGINERRRAICEARIADLQTELIASHSEIARDFQRKEIIANKSSIARFRRNHRVAIFVHS